MEKLGKTQELLPYNKNHRNSIGKGDMLATVEELYSWYLALEQNKVLKAETRTIMETAFVPEKEDQISFYEYSWAIFNLSSNTKVVARSNLITV